MFTRAGHGDLVALARAGAQPGDLLTAMPEGMERSVGLVGSRSDISRLLRSYREAGLAVVCVVPVTASGDGGRNALRVVRELSAASEDG